MMEKLRKDLWKLYPGNASSSVLNIDIYYQVPDVLFIVYISNTKVVNL